MVVTNNGLSSISANLGGSGIAIPSYFAIGSGTTAESVNDLTLVHEYDRNSITSTDNTIAKSVTWIGDFSSVEVSGLLLSEFGLLNASSNGNLFHREVLATPVQFDGDVELQLQTTFRFT